MGRAKQSTLERRDARKARREKRNSGEVADFASADPLLLSRAICTLARVGGALRFGYTRDGGAYAIGVYYDGEHDTEYLRPDESLDDYLRGLIEDYDFAGTGTGTGS